MFKYERKVVCNILPVVSASTGNVFYKYLITQTKHVKKSFISLFAVYGLYFLKEIIDESHSRTVKSIISLSLLPLLFFR